MTNITNMINIYISSITSVRDKLGKLFQNRILKSMYMNVIFGFIDEKLKNADKLISSKWDPDVSGDATLKGPSTVYGTFQIDGKRPTLNISTFRICDSNGLYVSDERLLEHKGESFAVTIPLIAKWIAKMMKNATKEYNGIQIKPFYNNINLDIGTRVNADKYRDILIYFIKEELNEDHCKPTYKNDNGVCFDFSKWYINVCIFFCFFFYQI